MISGFMIGDRELIDRVSNIPEAIKPDVDVTVQKLGYTLQGHVQRDKLTGQVLKVQTGRLRSSIAQGDPDSRSRFESTPTTAIAYVGTNVKYGRTWELDGIPAHDVVPVRAKALRFEIDGVVLFRKRVHIPGQGPRPYLAPALQEMKPLIIEQLHMTLVTSTQRAMGK